MIRSGDVPPTSIHDATRRGACFAYSPNYLHLRPREYGGRVAAPGRIRAKG